MSAAARLAAAVELLVAALDVLDDVEDGDHSALVAEAGIAQALNVSTALLFLSQRAVTQLAADGIDSDRVGLIADALSSAGARATGGQFLDLGLEGRGAASSEAALDIARRKAGSLVAGACRAAALLGTTDQELLARYEEWGLRYGTAAQLANDLHDAQVPDVKSDVERGKASLPLVFISRHVGASRIDASPESLSDRLALSGALHFTWVVLEIERQACRTVLRELAARDQAVARLARIVG
jgi:geranylgeranyl pyrophosphate synthase